MDKTHLSQMKDTFDQMERKKLLDGKNVFLFGHCNATEELVGLLKERGRSPKAILDNNSSKWGIEYEGVPVVAPSCVLDEPAEETVICIAARAWSAMREQLQRMGFLGRVYRMVDYDPYAEPSLDEPIRDEKLTRLKRGMEELRKLRGVHADGFLVLCPYYALGDIVYAMNYLDTFLEKNDIQQHLVIVPGGVCSEIVRMYGHADVVSFEWMKLTEVIQAVLYTEDKNALIVHNDKPYVVNLQAVLRKECIPFGKLYCCGVYGLPFDTAPKKPVATRRYPDLGTIRRGKSVLISPYANSMTRTDASFWSALTGYLKEQGLDLYTNVADGEEALEGTIPVSPALSEIQSFVEHAGYFIGLRSGLCDVLQFADCKKTALFPRTFYSDTKWRYSEIFRLDGWNNIELTESTRAEEVFEL